MLKQRGYRGAAAPLQKALLSSFAPQFWILVEILTKPKKSSIQALSISDSTNSCCFNINNNKQAIQTTDFHPFIFLPLRCSHLLSFQSLLPHLAPHIKCSSFATAYISKFIANNIRKNKFFWIKVNKIRKLWIQLVMIQWDRGSLLLFSQCVLCGVTFPWTLR